MTTRAEYLSSLRLRLNDAASAPRWPDSELVTYLDDAARDYSKYFPRKREQSFVADGVSTRYPVPDDLIDDQIFKVVIVWSDQPEQSIPHEQLKLRGSTRYWEVVDDQIVFAWVPMTDAQITLRYNATHSIPATGNATIPFEDEDLIYAFAMAAAWQRIGGNDAALSRWNDDKKRDDSPLIPHYVRLWERYNRLISQKLGIPRFYQRVRPHGRWRKTW